MQRHVFFTTVILFSSMFGAHLPNLIAIYNLTPVDKQYRSSPAISASHLR